MMASSAETAEDKAAETAEDKAARMYELELQRIEAERRAHRKRAVKIFLWVVVGLVVVSGMLFSNAGLMSEWQMLHPPAAATITISAVLAVVVAATVVRKHVDDFVLLMLWLMIVGVSFAVVGFGYFAGANAWFDDSPARQHRVKVHDRLYQRNPRSLVKRQRLVVDSWQTRGARETIYVEVAVYEADPSSVVVTTRDGFFGYTWIEGVTVASSRARP